MSGLEHGWLVGSFGHSISEKIGNCDWCGEPIYSDEYFTRFYGDLICECCEKERREQEEREDDALWKQT